MKHIEFIYENGNHKWAAITRDPDKPDYLIDTNEFLIINGTEAILTDPGGMEVFASVISAISTEYDPRQIICLFASHRFLTSFLRLRYGWISIRH